MRITQKGTDVRDDNRLLGTPPDQITEGEKLRRLQALADRLVASFNRVYTTFDERIAGHEERIAISEEEHELDRRYPGVP